MKTLLVASVGVVALLICSAAWAGVTYVSPVLPVAAPPVRVVYHYWPTAPVYAYPAPVVVAPSATVPPLVVAPPPVLVPAAVYPAPAVIRAKVFYYGRPVRNTVRVLAP